MKKNTQNALVAGGLLFLLAAAAGYFGGGYFKLRGRMADVEARTERAEAEAAAQRAVLSVDSLLLLGDLAGARRAYEAQRDTGNSPDLIAPRLALLDTLVRMRDRLASGPSFLSVRDTVRVGEERAAAEARRVDSLNFALAKTQAQLDKLKGLVARKSFGEYLTFKNAKGTAVTYVGQVKGGEANGRGVALLSTGSRYEGEWRSNQRHGRGTFFWPDGQYYEGEYRDDRRHGQGTYHWPNGDKFVGGWRDDQRHGQGTFYNKKGEVIASGEWRNDELVDG
ncbi:MAG: hypothetical protein WBA12_03435 [Catalinimonas sp.]